jgi:hypothetical protein
MLKFFYAQQASPQPTDVQRDNLLPVTHARQRCASVATLEVESLTSSFSEMMTEGDSNRQVSASMGKHI